MINRLEKFWEFGHNCAVLELTVTDVDVALMDNRFDPWAMTEDEKSQFWEGYSTRPLQWTRDTLKPIGIRPRWIGDNAPATVRRDRKQEPRPKRPTTEETRIRARESSKAYWNSVPGRAMREAIRDFTMRSHEKRKADAK